MKEKILFWFKTNLWTEKMVMDAVPSLISKEDAKEIISSKGGNTL